MSVPYSGRMDSEAQIINEQDTSDGMDCVVCGLSAEIDLDTWTPVWADNGSRFVGMNCGGH